MFRRKKDTTETQKAKESKEAKDAQEYGQDSDSSSESEAPAPSQSPESSPEARGPAMPQHLKSSLRPHESQEIVYVLSNPGQQESASKRIVKNSNVEKSKTRKEKADRPSTDSDEECNLATPFIWTMGMVQKLVQFCSETPPPR
ncbi:hypothetical protein MRX96_045965 [Rhipicephalus microplus]